MEQEEQAKDRQGANGVASAIVLPAMSSFPSLVSILFFFAAIGLSPDLSHPVFQRRPSANYMCAQDVHMTHIATDMVNIRSNVLLHSETYLH